MMLIGYVLESTYRAATLCLMLTGGSWHHLWHTKK